MTSAADWHCVAGGAALPLAEALSGEAVGSHRRVIVSPQSAKPRTPTDWNISRRYGDGRLGHGSNDREGATARDGAVVPLASLTADNSSETLTLACRQTRSFFVHSAGRSAGGRGRAAAVCQ